MSARRPTIGAPAGEASNSSNSFNDDGEGERPMSRKNSSGSRKHVTISDESSTLHYDPEKPSAQPAAPPKPVVSYKPSRRSEVWDNRVGEVIDSSDDEHPQNRGMQPFEVEQRRQQDGGDRCSDKLDRCSDRCVDQCVVM
mmetsp:Transcript_39264/g.73252  ORF Transcript_39264/g.73252 Transcript_39264/m.73252 type:complete len:140 (+) Transcript_39264:57-476(+)